MRYVLGVDGGNSKTDYLLYDMEGNLAAHLRAGTCSHEVLGMDGAHLEMDARIHTLLENAAVTKADVAAAAFGLAGIDQAFQQAALSDIVRQIGFPCSIAMNDSFLGLKAGSPSGTGVSSINGTGTAAGGIDEAGNWLQVGGFGQVFTGDEAGGSYIAGRTVRAVYDAIFRFGPQTAMQPDILRLFACQTPEDLHCNMSTMYIYGDAVKSLDIINILFAHSTAGDAVARGLVEHVADALARSAGGCAARLQFGAEVPVILIGSVWAKGRHQPMIDHFAAQFTRYSGKAPSLHILTVPPAVGSILWALELANGKAPDAQLREKVICQAQAL